jgi:hypothetical protein
MREGIIVSFLMKNPISNNFTSQNISFVLVDGLGDSTGALYQRTAFTDPSSSVLASPSPKSNPQPKQPQHNHNTTSPPIHKQSPTMAPPAYIISRTLDPIFALFIGLGAASMRINREEKELGRSTKETIDAGLR